jgi:hypothetical protein
MKPRHALLPATLLLLLAACACAWLPGTAESEIQLTNEAVMATNDAVSTLVVATLTAEAAAAETPSPAMTMTPETIYLHLQISDGRQPLEAMIYLYWPDTGGEFEVGPTSNIELPILAEGLPFEMTVSADGYLDKVQVLTPTKSFNLIIRMIEE